MLQRTFARLSRKFFSLLPCKGVNEVSRNTISGEKAHTFILKNPTMLDTRYTKVHHRLKNEKSVAVQK